MSTESDNKPAVTKHGLRLEFEALLTHARSVAELCYEYEASLDDADEAAVAAGVSTVIKSIVDKIALAKMGLPDLEFMDDDKPHMTVMVGPAGPRVRFSCGKTHVVFRIESWLDRVILNQIDRVDCVWRVYLDGEFSCSCARYGAMGDCEHSWIVQQLSLHHPELLRTDVMK